jgi:uncharacterized protein
VWLLALSLVLGLTSLASADVAVSGTPPTPTEWVTDNVAALRQETRSSLSSRLGQYSDSFGHQVLVWIGDTTSGVPLEDFTSRAFAEWKVGRKGIDDGVVLFLFVRDRRVRIEVGYGLEDKIPDAVASRIIRETIVPRMRSGDVDGAVLGGVEAIIAQVEGKLAPEAPAVERSPPALSLLQIVLFVVVGLLVIAFLVTHPALAAFFLVNFLSQGHRDGGSPRGGGFMGSGGRSGGGGASGSW